MLSRCGCGSQRADDDGEDADNALGPYHAQCEHGEFSVVRAIDEELPVHGFPEIREERSSPTSPLSCSSGLRHSQSAVPTTSSASSRLENVHSPLVFRPLRSQAASRRRQKCTRVLEAVRELRAVSLGVGCPLHTSTSKKLVFHLLQRRRHLQLLGQDTRLLYRQA